LETGRFLSALSLLYHHCPSSTELLRWNDFRSFALRVRVLAAALVAVFLRSFAVNPLALETYDRVPSRPFSMSSQ
jgi:hypothetical protein